MAVDREDAVRRARADLAKRLNIPEGSIKEAEVAPADFPDAALGAPVEGEMSAQMITPGLRIRLSVGNEGYEYRAANKQLRLYQFKGSNFRV